jgi:tetratricopeptide (TPR) repeat protein
MDACDRRAVAEAMVHLDRYEQLRPKDPFAANYTLDWIYLGVCLSCQGRLHDAREAYRRATQCEGDPDEAWLNVGLISRALGELEAARHAAAQALALCPEYPAAERLLADVSAALALLDKVTCD